MPQNNETVENGRGRKIKILWRKEDNYTKILSAYCFRLFYLALSFLVAKLTEKKGGGSGGGMHSSCKDNICRGPSMVPGN